MAHPSSSWAATALAHAAAMVSAPFVVALGLAAWPISVHAAAVVPFRVAAAPWDRAALGNHRAVVEVPSPGVVAHVVIPWRRPDRQPELKHVVLTDSAGRQLRNVKRGDITRERGELWFEPSAGPGTYFVYYLPHVSGGRSNYPTVTYPPPRDEAAPDWVARVASTQVVEAVVTAIEAVDALNSFDPMEVIATQEEVDRLRRTAPGAAFLVFPEDRDHPVRMRRDLPKRWADGGTTDTLSVQAARGEYLAFQLAIFALRPLSGVGVRFTDLSGPGGASIPAAAISCINTHGVDYRGEPFERTLDVAQDAVQAIWCGIRVPSRSPAGAYTGQATVSAAGADERTVVLALEVEDATTADPGADEPWHQTRLTWLNSTLAQRNDVIAPYTPLRVEGHAVHLLGRRVALGPLGLPESVRTFFTQEMTSLSERPTDVLASPAQFVAEAPAGDALAWESGGVSFTERSEGTVRWSATATAPGLETGVSARMEFDGFLAYRVSVKATKDLDLADLRLELPFRKSAARYLMGLGQKGGACPSRLDWTWDVATRNQDGAWIGTVNAGLFFSLRGDNYGRPLNTNFYLQKPLALPPSWGNDGRGGISIVERGDTVLVRAFSGRRRMKAGEVQHYDLTLIVTPFHPIDTDAQWRTRFYHRYAPVDTVRATGASVVNVHHATPINPWINYPFIAHREMKAYVDEAHAKGLLVKIYNTVRELSNRAYELFPLRSLGHEIFSPGPGGGFAWLQEHLEDDYIAAWFVPDLEDAAIINSGMSRWHNYYVEGINWLVRHVGIDGLYLDDVAFDRTTMKRVKRVLVQEGRPGVIDLHSANQFNQRDGYVNSSILYLEHFPYVNRLWFGEYFDYQRNSPDFYLTEVSGIPFGLMGEMLEGGGNPWRGMVFGMTNRLPWSEESDPRPLWRAWDEFGMAGTRMIGWWVDGRPVKTDRADVLATVYAKPGRALVALASWADADVEVGLQIDWAALGIDPARAVMAAGEIDGFQPAVRFTPGQRVRVPKGRGWLLTLREER
jgi:hypothetical protein